MRPQNGHPILGQQLPYDGFGFVFPVIMAPATTLFLLALLAASPARALETNLVANGSFEQSRQAGRARRLGRAPATAPIKQQLALDTGRDGKRCAKLDCTEFTGDGPDFHAMICQVGKVSVRQGHWYRLTFWAKAEGIEDGRGRSRALATCAGGRTPAWPRPSCAGTQWEQFEFLFRARQRPAGRGQPAAVLVQRHRHALAGRRGAGRVGRGPAVVPADRHRGREELRAEQQLRVRRGQLGQLHLGPQRLGRQPLPARRRSGRRRRAARPAQPEDRARAADAAGVLVRLLRAGPPAGPPRAGGQPGLVPRASPASR